MIINYLEKLDKALIYLSRVDIQIEFIFTICDQIRDIFIYIYLNENNKVPKRHSRSSLINSVLKLTLNNNLNKLVEIVNRINRINNINNINEINKVSGFKGGKYLAYNYLSSKRLRALADTFANCIPKGKFLPAKI